MGVAPLSHANRSTDGGEQKSTPAAFLAASWDVAARLKIRVAGVVLWYVPDSLLLDV